MRKRTMRFRRLFLNLWFAAFVYICVLFSYLGLFAFFISRQDTLWGLIGSLLMLAPFPVGFLLGFSLAHGEWLYNEIQTYHLNRSAWIEKRSTQFLKFLLFAVVVGFLALIVAILNEEFHQQMRTLFTIAPQEILKRFLIALGILFSFSAFSLWAYKGYLERKGKRKRKRLAQELHRVFGKTPNREQN